jgi:hypothetical protein
MRQAGGIIGIRLKELFVSEALGHGTLQRILIWGFDGIRQGDISEDWCCPNLRGSGPNSSFLRL